MAFGADPQPKQASLGVMAQQILTVDVNDGEGFLAIDRLIWPDKTLYTEAVTGTYGIVDVSLSVFDETGSDPTTAIYTASPNLAVATAGSYPQTSGVLYDALQTNAVWDIDSTGFNFAHWIAPTLFEREGGHVYRACYTFNPHSGNFWGQTTWQRRYRVQGSPAT